jgi:hypothetical protein
VTIPILGNPPIGFTCAMEFIATYGRILYCGPKERIAPAVDSRPSRTFAGCSFLSKNQIPHLPAA